MLQHEYALKTSRQVKEATYKRMHVINSIYIRLRLGSLWRQKVNWWLARDEVGKNGVTAMDFLWGDENILQWITVMVAQLREFTKTTQLHILSG